MKKRIPRKLKKGLKTFNPFGPQRTKWQRRAELLIDKMFIHFIADAIATRCVKDLKPGGYVAPSNQPQQRSDELILSREQLLALTDKINDGCNGAITATIDGDRIAEGIHRVQYRTIIK